MNNNNKQKNGIVKQLSAAEVLEAKHHHLFVKIFYKKYYNW